jgi:hypothetical protein
MGICEKGHELYFAVRPRKWKWRVDCNRDQRTWPNGCVSSRPALLGWPISIKLHCRISVRIEQPCASKICSPNFQIFWLFGPFVLNGEFYSRRSTYQRTGNLGTARKTFMCTSLVVYEIYIIIHSIIFHRLKYVASTVVIFFVFDVEAHI